MKTVEKWLKVMFIIGLKNNFRHNMGYFIES